MQFLFSLIGIVIELHVQLHVLRVNDLNDLEAEESNFPEIYCASCAIDTGLVSIFEEYFPLYVWNFIFLIV